MLSDWQDYFLINGIVKVPKCGCWCIGIQETKSLTRRKETVLLRILEQDRYGPLEMGLYLMKLRFNQMNRVLCQLFACNIILFLKLFYLFNDYCSTKLMSGLVHRQRWQLRFLTRQMARRCSGVFSANLVNPTTRAQRHASSHVHPPIASASAICIILRFIKSTTSIKTFAASIDSYRASPPCRPRRLAPASA